MFQVTEDPSSGNLVQCLDKNYKNDSIVSVDMDKVGVNGIILRPVVLVFSSKYRKALPYGMLGRSRELPSTFKYFIILIVPTYYILCISWIIKC